MQQNKVIGFYKRPKVPLKPIKWTKRAPMSVGKEFGMLERVVVLDATLGIGVVLEH